MKRKIAVSTAFALVALIAPSAASASDGPNKADGKDALQAARAAFATQLSSAGSPDRDATLALRELAINLPALKGADRRAAIELLRRPTDLDDRNYFGKEAKGSPRCDANFCIHWTDKGPNAPASDKFLEDVRDSVDASFAVENTALGWPAAVSDGSRGSRKGVGGEGQVDVYIRDLGGQLYGYAAPDAKQKGQSRFAFLVLDNDYRGFPSSPINSLRVTVAHEYNHVLQFGIDTLQDLWLFESTATWIEEQVYPEINDYLNYLQAFTRGTESPMTTRDYKIYSEAVFNHWLSGRYGTQVVRDVWAASGTGVKPKHLATAAYTAGVTANGGKTFSEEFGEFAAATAEWRSNPVFPDAKVYPEVRRRGTLSAKPEKVRLDNTSFRLVKVKGGTGPVTLNVKAQNGTASTIALVGRTGPTDGGVITPVVVQLPEGGAGSVTLPAGNYDRITAAIINSDGRSSGKKNRQAIYPSDGSKYTYSLG